MEVLRPEIKKAEAEQREKLAQAGLDLDSATPAERRQYDLRARLLRILTEDGADHGVDYKPVAELVADVLLSLDPARQAFLLAYLTKALAITVAIGMRGAAWRAMSWIPWNAESTITGFWETY